MSKGNWTREESILAFSRYCKTPFGKINKNNPRIIELDFIIGRTPSAVGMKMCNFGRFDPELRSRNISGLQNGSKMDEIVWNEFFQNSEDLIEESASIIAHYKNQPIVEQVDLTDLPYLPEDSEKAQIIKARLIQQFFREALLSSYRSVCYITGINIPELLIASHIKP